MLCRYASTPGTKDERLEAIKCKWNALTQEEAQRYHNKAEADRTRYKRDVLQYRAIILKHQLVAFYQRYDPQKLREVDLDRIAQHFAPQPAQLDQHLRQVCCPLCLRRSARRGRSAVGCTAERNAPRMWRVHCCGECTAAAPHSRALFAPILTLRLSLSLHHPPTITAN